MAACIFRMTFIIEGLTRHVVTSIIGDIVKGGGILLRGVVCTDVTVAAR
jgi:hypothetical protein